MLLLGLLAGLPAQAGELAELGRRLFADPSFSAGRNQSCASCHDPNRAFTDGRDGGVDGAASRGSDERLLGDRNAPTLAYAALVPPFGRDEDGEYRGGLFHDGRARDLAAQAGEPVLNPIEMALPDRAAVVARIRERPDYVEAFEREFGADILDDVDAAFAAFTAALAAFQAGPEFIAFDSRYDRYLRGEIELNEVEELGRRLYFSDLVNCMRCHLLDQTGISERDPFTDHRYHNIGIPVNAALRAANGSPAGRRDRGLAENPAAAGDPAAVGRYRTPTQRHIAVTAPYMHN
ncbi:MAG: cytochrome-c peroxidase, partial [Gammaproteobacteria bacterium]